MKRVRIILLLLVLFFSSFANAIRLFPAGTIFGSIKSINYPQITLQEVPSNWFSSMLGMMLLSQRRLLMSPASIIRDQSNRTEVQAYLNNLQNVMVGVQLDYQGRVWTIWILTRDEAIWVIQNRLNIWP